MSHEVSRFELQQLRASMAASEAEARELHYTLNGTVLRLEGEATELWGRLELERTHHR